MQALVDGQHGGDGDEEGGSAAAVQMADDGDETGHQSNADDVVADLLHQRTDDLVEHACIGHDAEEQDGEDEQDSRTVDALDALLDKASHFIQGESTGSHQNGCGDGRDADECQCRDRDIAQQQDDDRNHRCKAEQSEDRITHGFVLPFLFRILGMHSVLSSRIIPVRYGSSIQAQTYSPKPFSLRFVKKFLNIL